MRRLGRIGRIRFGVGFLGVFFTLGLAHYRAAPWLAENWPALAQADLDYGFLPLLFLISPLIILRFHDLNSSGWWSLLPWIVLGAGDLLPFELEVGFLVLCMLLLLLLKAGNPERN